jgi:hypothetical protein
MAGRLCHPQRRQATRRAIWIDREG